MGLPFRWRTSVQGLCVMPFLLSCSLLQEATTFTLDTGWKDLAVDATGLPDFGGAATLPNVPCTKAQDTCATGLSNAACTGGNWSCKTQCGESASCALAATVELGLPVDISAQVKNQTSANVISKATLNEFVYNTLENTLNVDTPELELYVGPSSATRVGDPGVVFFARMPRLPAGTKRNEILKVDEAGKEALASFVRNYTQPFKILAKGSSLFNGGQALPKGRLRMQLKAKFQVTPL